MPKPIDSDWGEPRPRTPAPRIEPVFLWPTPDKADYLFFVEKKGELPSSQKWTYGERYPDIINYPKHKLIYVSPQTDDKWSRWYYASDRLTEDDYNWEFTKCDMAGTEYSAIRRTYLILRSEFSETEPAMASANPNVPEDKFSEGYILAMRQQQRTQDQQFDSIYVAETRVYIKRCAITANGIDPLNGKPLPASYEIYHISESVGGTPVLDLVSTPTHAYWGVQTNGFTRTFRALSCEWYRFDTEYVVAGTFASGVVDVGSYNSSVNYYWPPVLDTIEFMDWERRDGSSDIHPRVTFAPDDYRGPCKALIQRSWSKTPQTLLTLNQMLPTPIIYGAPFFNLNIPACLHGAITAQCDIGNADPIYAQNAGSSRTTAATNYTTWPASIVAADDQEPYKGGYLRTTTTVYKPA